MLMKINWNYRGSEMKEARLVLGGLTALLQQRIFYNFEQCENA